MPATAAAKPRKPKQNWKTRRLKAAKRAAKRASLTVKIQGTVAYELCRSCGWNPEERDMRHPEPPTRSTNGVGSRLNRVNGWHQDGPAASCVEIIDSAVLLWFSVLPDEAQDELCDLSHKCSEKARVSSTMEGPEIGELLTGQLKPTPDREDPRQWARKEK